MAEDRAPRGPTLGDSDRSKARPREHGEEPTSIPDPAVALVNDSALAEAFRDLHGSRLHGFALLVTLGAARAAERIAGEALAAGAAQAAALRHPERAAAWLRARALRGMHQGNSLGGSAPGSARREALAALGVDDAVFAGLAALSVDGRAALVASAIERFEAIDTETILGAAPAATRRVIAEARERYLQVVGNQPAGQPDTPPDYQGGALAVRIRSVATRAMSAGEASR